MPLGNILITVLFLCGNRKIGIYLSLRSCIVFNRGQALVSTTSGILVVGAIKYSFDCASVAFIDIFIGNHHKIEFVSE